MVEENKAEQTAEVKEEVVEETQEPKVNNDAKFTEEDMNNIVKSRLAKERASIYKKLDVEDLETAIEAVRDKKLAEEKNKIQKGEFEKLLKEKSEEYGKKIGNLESELRDIKINKALLSSASKNRAINPDQVVELLKHNIKLNESGNVEILDKNGIARYNNKGETLTTDELVQEFLTQNPHFVNDPEDRKAYAKYRAERNSKPTIIQNKT